MWCTSAYRTRLDWFQWSSFWSKGSFICWWSVQLQGRNWEQWRLYTGGIDGKNYKMTPLLEAFCWFVAPQAVFITTLLRANKNVRRWWEARWVFARLKSDTLTEQREHICKTSYCLSCVCFLFKLCSLMCLTQSRRVVLKKNKKSADAVNSDKMQQCRRKRERQEMWVKCENVKLLMLLQGQFHLLAFFFFSGNSLGELVWLNWFGLNFERVLRFWVTNFKWSLIVITPHGLGLG